MLNGAMPPFDLDSGIVVVVARGLTTAALLSVFGGCLFVRFVMPRCQDRMPPDSASEVAHRLSGQIAGGLLCASVALLIWLVVQAAAFADADTAGAASRAVPPVLLHTRFGHVLLLQLAAVAATALLYRRPTPGTVSAGVALALQAGHSHALAMQDGPRLLLASELAHLLAAGGWLGGLIPLLTVVVLAPPRAAAMAARWFSPLGKICVAVTAITALFQGVVMVGSLPALTGTAYGLVALGKVALFGVLVGFALLNRYRLAPALMRGDPAGARRRLIRSIAVQTGFGVLIVLVAGLLASLPPGMDTKPA